MWQPTPHHVKVRAPGKINAFFQVGPLREDGYHAVASTYLAVSRYEEVAATSKPGRPAADITVSISEASSLDPESLAGIPLDGSNLAVRAAMLVADIAEDPCGVHLEITKHVPIAGGMGGGSADAAATLVACDALWHTGLSREELSLLGAELGADVPFALLGVPPSDLALGTNSQRRWPPHRCTGCWCRPALACQRRWFTVRLTICGQLPDSRPPSPGKLSRVF